MDDESRRYPERRLETRDPIAQKQANLLDILSHRTGLPRHDVGLRRGETAAEGVKALRYLRPSVEFREA